MDSGKADYGLKKSLVRFFLEQSKLEASHLISYPAGFRKIVTR